MPSILTRLEQNAAPILLLLAAAVLAPIYWTALHAPAAGIYHDDSIYLNTAQALAEGRGYWIESIPEPIPQTKYPILFPALLATVWKLVPDFPNHVLYFKLVPFFAAIVWFCLSYLLIQEHCKSAVFAATAVSLTAASPQVVFFSTTILSETLFAAMATASIFFGLKDRRDGSRVALLLSAFFAAAAYHTRTIGFCLILGWILVFLWQRRWREGLLFGSVAGALALPWVLWQSLNSGAADPYLSQENYYSAYNVVVSFNWQEKLRIVVTNLMMLLISMQSFFEWSGGKILGLICVPLILRALLAKEIPLIVRSFLLLSIGVILLWVWPPFRFLVPLMPLLIWAVWSGAPNWLRKLVVPCCWLLFGQGVYASGSFSNAARESGLWIPTAVGKEEWRTFMKQLDWIRENTPQKAIIQSNIDPTVYLYTQRKAIRGSHQNASLSIYLDREKALGTASQYVSTLNRNKVDFVVETQLSWFLESRFFGVLIDEVRKEQLLQFRLRNESDLRGFRIFEIEKPQNPNQNR